MTVKKAKKSFALDDQTASLLTELAKKRGTSVSALAQELILEALDRDEDLYFSRLADERDTKKAKLVPFEDAWK